MRSSPASPPELPITARETQTAEGFVLDGSPQSILIKEGEVQTLTFWNAREGGVELVKVNAADKTERLSDAVFEIRKASDDALVDTVTTGDTGSVFAPLAEGDYYALEQESPSGFKLDSTRHYFSVKDGEVTQEVIENEAISGILVHKISTADGDGIPGISFILYDSGHNPIDQQTTDDRGYAWFEDLEGGGRFTCASWRMRGTSQTPNCARSMSRRVRPPWWSGRIRPSLDKSR